jgi:hypothetical protein
MGGVSAGEADGLDHNMVKLGRRAGVEVCVRVLVNAPSVSATLPTPPQMLERNRRAVCVCVCARVLVNKITYDTPPHFPAVCARAVE